MANSDILKLADAVADLIRSNLASGSEWEVNRVYEIKHNLGTFTESKIDVVPGAYADEGPSTRKDNWFDALISIVVTKRYQDAGDVPDEWMDDLIDFVETNVFNVFSANDLEIDESWWPQAINVVVLYDMEQYRRNKTFWSEVEVTFRKPRT